MKITDMDFTDSRVQEFLANQESQDVQSPDDFRFEVLDLVKNGENMTGITLPWEKTHDRVRLREGEVSVWAGINGHMKSMVLGQVAMWAARDVTVGIASFEMPVAATLRRMVSQASGSKDPAVRFANDFVTWADQRMWFYNRLDSVPAARVLGCVLHMGKEKGCKLIVVDSLMMCGVTDDMERERKFMAQLTALAKSLKIHVALVHHVRKPAKGDDSYIPSRFDVKGNGAIVDLASTLFLCWNDKKKHEHKNTLSVGGQLTDEQQDYYENAPDQLLIVAKQRHAEFEGNINLWMSDCLQFTATSNRRPARFDIPRLEGVA
jgi:twinkle protein